MNYNLPLLAISLVAFVGSPALSATATDTQAFINEAAAGNIFEIESSKLARDRAQDEEVRDFAARMIIDHEHAGEELKKTIANQKSKITMPDETGEKHQRILDKLRAANGAEFDKAYLDAQVKAHDETVALFQDYADKGQDSAIKGFVAKTLPTLEHHKDMVHDIAEEQSGLSKPQEEETKMMDDKNELKDQ